MQKGFDDIALRHEIIEKMADIAPNADDKTIEKMKALIVSYTGNTLKVLYFLVTGDTKQKDIACKIGISEAAVSKIVKIRLEKMRSYLYFTAGAIPYKPEDYRTFRHSRKKVPVYETMEAFANGILTSAGDDGLYDAGGDAVGGGAEKSADLGDDYSDGNSPITPGQPQKRFGYVNLKKWPAGGWEVGMTNPTEFESLPKNKVDDYIMKEILQWHRENKK